MGECGVKKLSSVDLMNLISVQRIDPQAVAIIDKSTHTALYNFDSSSGSWAKTDVEGPLLVYARSDVPKQSLIIANRQSLSDHIQPITSSLRLSCKDPYIFINKTEESVIYGIWFFERRDCFRIFSLLNKLVQEQLETPPPEGSEAAASSNVNESENVFDICHLLPNAHTPQSSNGTKPSKQPTAEGGSEMPVMLQKLLADDAATSRRVVVKGAVTAYDVEREFIQSALERKLYDSVSRLSLGEAKLPVNYSSVSLGALSTTAVEGSETATNPDESEEATGRKQLGSSDEGNPLPVTGLTKEQLVQAVDHLLRTDDDFICRLHRAYLDSLNSRLGV